MKSLLTTSVIAMSAALPAFASTFFPGPGAVSLTDADVAIGFAVDNVTLLANDTPTWTFTNNSSTDIVLSDFVGSGLTQSETALASVLIGFGTATQDYDIPFQTNGANVSGDATLPDIFLAQGDSIDLIFDASSAFSGLDAPAFLYMDYVFNVAAVPVPASLPLAMAGLGALAFVRRKAS